VPHVPFAQIPDHARIWIFGSAEPIVESDARRLLERVDEFVGSWLAHGQPVVGGYDWRYDRFLIVAADERATGVSGCSIDSLFRSLRDVERETGRTLLDSSPVWFRDQSGEIRSVPRGEFRQLMRDGDVPDDALVFDNTVNTVGALRSGEWERPLRESWHGKAFLGAGR
jgi:hypothetical protein